MRKADIQQERSAQSREQDRDTATSPATERLLRAAATLAANPAEGGDDHAAHASLRDFLRLYSDWIVRHRGMSGSLETWAEQSKILVHCMIGAATLGEAIDLLVRFSRAFWGDYAETTLRDEGEATAIIFDEPTAIGPEGMIRAMWPLIATLSQLEFLAGGKLRGITGRLRHTASLPRDTTTLLFRRPLAYDAGEAALIVPKHQLRRAVVARAADVPAFFAQFMATTVGATREPRAMRAAVGGLIRADKLRETGAPDDLPSIAERLGCSVATLRRRLRDEHTSFRETKEDVFDDLAKIWLRDSDYTIERIATRLGYSDPYGFRRAFGRRNGCPPLSYRRGGSSGGTAAELAPNTTDAGPKQY